MVKKKKTEKASADTFSVDGLVLVFGLGLGLRSWSSVLVLVFGRLRGRFRVGPCERRAAASAWRSSPRLPCDGPWRP